MKFECVAIRAILNNGVSNKDMNTIARKTTTAIGTTNRDACSNEALPVTSGDAFGES